MTETEGRPPSKGSVPAVGSARAVSEVDSAASPWSTPSPKPAQQVPPEQPQTGRARSRGLFGAVVFAGLLLASVLIPAYRDLSSPGAWTYWKDLFVSPSMKSSTLRTVDGRKALAIEGHIGPASSSWFRDQLDAAKLNPGDVIFLSSPGGSLDQGIIMGEVVRSRGLTTVVGTLDSAGRAQPSRCASACVFVFAGGKIREAMPRSALGVHQFTSISSKGDESANDIVARTQRTTGIILGYMTRMGVSPSIMQAMTASKDIRWLSEKEAFDLNLVTARYPG